MEQDPPDEDVPPPPQQPSRPKVSPSAEPPRKSEPDQKKRRLDEWDPDVVVQLYALLYRCQSGLGYSQSELPEQRARVVATWERLCQLDGSTALRTLQALG